MSKQNKMAWRDTSQLAKFWHKAKDKVQCELCPRHCELKIGQKGFCLVRGNVNDELHTFNYGISVQATIENIETEAVYHFRPGAKILSMGNIGCMMSCSFCQNWQTSQAKLLSDENVYHYAPQDVIDLAIENDIKIISWTYNDPVVWQEFVVDTSKLAKKNGIKTLYKSALYIEEEPLKELLEVIDIFSISLKGMDSIMYKKFTKGELEPVLERIKLIGKSNRHLEISQLIVTDMNDNGENARKTTDWITENLGKHIPLHLVAYHPAFRYNKERTSVDTLLRLRDIVLNRGLQYCYLGNVYADHVSNTNCLKCNHRLVKRFGLSIEVVGIDEKDCCTNCGEKTPVEEAHSGLSHTEIIEDFVSEKKHRFEWNKEVNNIHVVLEENTANTFLKLERNPGNKIEYFRITKNLERIIISKSFSDEQYILISANDSTSIDCLPVLDRAHFPLKNKSSFSDKYLN